MATQYRSFIVSFITLALISICSHAEKLTLSTITAPDNIENIYVEKISSDTHSTDFIIFIKKQVPLHKHLTHTESIYVLEGEGIFNLAGETIEIGPGDYLRIPQNTAHAVTVISAIPLKVLSIQAPEFFGKDRILIDEPKTLK